MTISNYNPDVLSCLANLSSDEVFTPPNIVNQMLDLLPAELWRDPNATFLDPACKSGVFLREIAKRLLVGLEGKIPDLQERINHIFTRQLYGIAITEITALLSRRTVYCSKTANGKYSVVEGFADEQGNIRLKRIEHTWQNERCKWCRASRSEYDRGPELESHAYEFIHTDQPKEIFNMQFDVIIGNPPYQLSDGGGKGKSARPIYQLFVTQAIKLNPRFLCMIIPARWFSGGKGLDEFRRSVTNDDRIQKLVDFQSATAVFPGVDIAGGVCYFLWARDYHGHCEVFNALDDDSSSCFRRLNEFNTFVRSNKAVSIVRKILQTEDAKRNLSTVVSRRMPFGLPSTYKPQGNGIPCWFTQRIGRKYARKSDIRDEDGFLDKWKLLIPFAPIAGQTDFTKPVAFYYDGNTIIAKPGECCTESWLVACAFPSRHQVESFKSYLFTKVVRFLLLQAVTSQNVTRQYFAFIPDLGKYDCEYTDEMLCERWGISEDEWELIDSRIRNVEVNGDE